MLTVVAVPAVVSIILGRNFVKEARLEHGRTELERRAQEVLVQDELAPRRWAERLAPDDLPDFAGFELGRVYQAGSGLMAGDFYDVVRVGPSRIAAVIGDVTGHGIDPAITAFQAKYLLRVFLRQYRDPAQALEELNTQMSAMGRHEEFISLCVVRVRHRGRHPALRLGRPPRRPGCGTSARCSPLRATGPLLMLDPEATYFEPRDPARPQRPVPALHRRAGRGPQRRPAVRRGAHRRPAPARPRGVARRAVQVAARGRPRLLQRPHHR